MKHDLIRICEKKNYAHTETRNYYNNPTVLFLPPNILSIVFRGSHRRTNYEHIQRERERSPEYINRLKSIERLN